MKHLVSILIVSLMAPASFAHEGHAHDDSAAAPHGGIVKEGKKLNLELVTQGKDVMVYPLAKDGKSLALKDISLTASAQPPKKAKIKVDFKPMNDHFHSQIDAKGSYRYELQIEAKASGGTEKFSFQVEPQG